MTVKEVVALAAELLGLDGVKAVLDGTSTEAENEVVALERAYNLVENELALDYFPLYCEETLDVESGRLYYRDLTRSAVRILSVRSEAGEALAHKIFPDYMSVDRGRVVVKYAYTPAVKDVNGEAEFGFGASLRLVAFGVAAEYCFMNGLYGEAEAWNKKYRAEITASYRARPAKTIKERRWV